MVELEDSPMSQESYNLLAGVSHNFLHVAILLKEERIKKGRFYGFTSQFQASLVRCSSDGGKGFTTQYGAEGEKGLVPVPLKTGDQNRRCRTLKPAKT